VKLHPTTRQFLAAAGFVVVIAALVLARGMMNFLNMTGSGGSREDAKFIVAEGAIGALIVLLGIGFAWLRLQRARKERQNRKPPTSFS
jgi:hypothetical protein